MVTVIIVHYYTPELLAKLLEELQVVVGTVAMPVEVSVVNNGGDITRVVKDYQLEIEVIDLPDNPGYAAAINQAMSQSLGELVYVMNCDISLSTESFAAIGEALRSFDVVGPRLLMHRADRFILPPVEPSSPFFKLLRTLIPRVNFLREELIFSIWWRSIYRYVTSSAPVTTTRLSGAFLAFKRKVFEQVGPFDERFRLYFEEVDWLQRVNRKGFRIGYVPHIEIYHFFNQSARRQPLAAQWFQQSQDLFIKKWFPALFIALLANIQKLPVKSGKSSKECWVRNKAKENFHFEDISCVISGQVRSPLYLLISSSSDFVPSAVLEVNKKFHWTPEKDFWDRMENGIYYFKLVDRKGRHLRP